MSVALVVIFNHRFDANIPRLADLFAGRFDAVSYLAPFTQDASPGVCRVYESSTAFSSHIAQAYERFRNDGVSHYLFIGDDLFLHPAITQDNVLAHLGAGPGDAYIKNLAPLEDAYYVWLHRTHVRSSFFSAGFDFARELPPAGEASARLRGLGLRPGASRFRALQDWDGRFNFRLMLTRPEMARAAARELRLPLPYPMAFGYSDLVLVPAACMERFVAYCGVFGAMNLFAEVAVPTALALACDSIKTELRMGDVFQRSHQRREGQLRHGLEIWGHEAIQAFEAAHGCQLPALRSSFPDDRLYVHPVKLSRWQP